VINWNIDAKSNSKTHIKKIRIFNRFLLFWLQVSKKY